MIHANPMCRRRVRIHEMLTEESNNDNNVSAEVNIGKAAKGIVTGLIYHGRNLKPRAERIGSFTN